jgi:hypothetical protein
MGRMFVWLKFFRFLFPFALIPMVGLTGCAHLPRIAKPSEVSSLRTALTALAPTVRIDEAEEVAGCAYEFPRILAARYRVVRPPLLHNFLVNSGFKQRGLCYEWAEDLLAQLQTFKLESLELHWGIARANTAREHNSIVVTVRGQPFEEGIVLDAWRRSGRLVWSPVSTDKYPWVEGELDPSPMEATQ